MQGRKENVHTEALTYAKQQGGYYNTQLMNLQKLKQLAASNDTAKSVFSALASRDRARSPTDIRRLAAEIRRKGSAAAYGDILKVFETLQSLSCGKLEKPRSGTDTHRFDWKVNNIEASRQALGMEPAAGADIKGVDTHTLVLRHSIGISIRLPSDVTQAELDDLAEQLRHLKPPHTLKRIL